MQTDVLAFRLPAREAEEVRRLARRHGHSLSDELRRAVRALAERERSGESPPSPPTG